MSQQLQITSWTRIFVEHLVSGVALANSQRAIVQIHESNLYATFGVVCTARAAGNIDLKLRFGFAAADVVNSTRGVNFQNLAAANTSDFGNVAAVSGAAVPNVNGSPPIILPPFIKVMLDAPAGVDLTYEVLAAYFYML